MQIMSPATPSRPIDVPTAETASFIEAHVARGGTIVEVGCGSGHVAAALMRRGFGVVGIDADAETVSRARKRGVNVIEASWPDLDTAPVDAVVFTRSLHHITPLQEAIAKVPDILEPDGILLVEDFAFDEVEPDAIAWLLRIIRSQEGRALISDTDDEFVEALLNADDAVEAWHREHDHDLHTVPEMTRAIEEFFEIRDRVRVPYLYRYLIDALPETREATSFVQRALQEESRLGESGEFPLIGYRIVATAR